MHGRATIIKQFFFFKKNSKFININHAYIKRTVRNYVFCRVFCM